MKSWGMLSHWMAGWRCQGEHCFVNPIEVLIQLSEILKAFVRGSWSPERRLLLTLPMAKVRAAEI